MTYTPIVPEQGILDTTAAVLLENIIAITDDGSILSNPNPYGVEVWDVLDDILVEMPPLKDGAVLEKDQDAFDLIGDGWRIVELLHTDRNGEFLIAAAYANASLHVWAEGGVYMVVKIPRKKGKKDPITEYYLLELVGEDD